MLINCFSRYCEGLVPDKRLRVRIEKTLGDLISNGSCIINKSVNSHTDKIGAYRMLSNKRFDHSDLLKASYRRCVESIDVDHVLAIQDTTEFNYQGIKRKLGKEDKDIGPTGINTIAGYFCHPMLIVNPDTNGIYGISSALFYNRRWDKKNKKERNYNRQPIEEKESYRWIKSAEKTKSLIDKKVKLTIIGDRESDIYEEFYTVPDERTHVLVRSRSNRNLAKGNGKLYDYITNQQIQGYYDLELSSNKKRTKRTAKIEIKYCKVSIAAPSNIKDKNKEITLWAIEAKESEETVPDQENPVLWRLLTTHKIESFEQAVECVNWYKKRWLIEELFRVIKTKGFQIESSQLSSGSKLKKLLALTLEAALHVMKLKLAMCNEESSIKTVFTENEQEFLEISLHAVEGKTEKQKNPYTNKSLAWSAWIIARMAGWSGYKSHGPPGYITIKEGYDRFRMQFKGYMTFKKMKDVYKD